MPVAKNLHPMEAPCCAAEAGSMVWAMIVILIALIAFGAFLFVAQLGG